MYYVVDYLSNPSDPDDEGPFLEIHQGDVRVDGVTSWHTGARFTVPIPSPLMIRATPRHGFVGAPQDFFGGTICFMSPRLLAIMTAHGVDNLDVYPAVVTYTTTGEQHPVHAFNLLGLVSAVDLATSQASSFDGDFRMDSSLRGFTVDEPRVGDRKLFRLAENCVTVLAHQRIKDAVDAAGIRTFSWVDPKRWIQL